MAKILLVTKYFPENKVTGGILAGSYRLSKHLAENQKVSTKGVFTDYFRGGQFSSY